MSFESLIEKVRQAEVALEAKERQTSANWRQAKATWRAAWTPGRIVVAGLVSGFVVGRAEPFKKAAGGGVLQLVSALSNVFAGAGAKEAADEAEKAAQAATGGGAAGVAPAAANATPAPAPAPFEYAMPEDSETPESLRRAGLL